MNSITSRITFWYVVTVTGTLACMFVAGHYLLQNFLVYQLDEWTETHFNHLKATLGPDYQNLPPSVIGERIRETTESASSLFYTDMHVSDSDRFFRSSNLKAQSLPDIPGQHAYNVELPTIGELRVREFSLKPFEVLVATPMTPMYEVMNGYRKVFAALLLAAVFVSAGFGFAFSKLMLRPVRLIQATAIRIGSHNLGERIPVGDEKDEISQLALFLNQMFDRLEASFSQIRRFTGDASHELKTPLSLVRLHMERLLTGGNLEPLQRESIYVQLEEMARVSKIIDELLFLSRADAQAVTLTLKEEDPASFLQQIAQDAAVLAEHHEIRFQYTHEGNGPCRFEANRIRQVLLNLVVNAINASPRGSCVSLHSRIQEESWQIAIDDEGPGLTAEQRERVFERFVRFTSKPMDVEGSGLGLAISRSIVQLHRGTVTALTKPSGQGLRMVIDLPRSEPLFA